MWGGQKKKSLILSLSQRISGLKCKVLKSYHSSLTYSKWEQISRNWSIFYQLKSPDYEYFSIFLSKNKKRLLAYRFGVLLLCFQKKTSKTKPADPRGPGFKARNHSSSPGRVWVTTSSRPLYNELFFSLPASINCTPVKWQNVNHLVTKWAPAAIVREWWCWRKRKQGNEVSCQKSTVQRVIWENMTTLQRQGVIMASQ